MHPHMHTYIHTYITFSLHYIAIQTDRQTDRPDRQTGLHTYMHTCGSTCICAYIQTCMYAHVCTGFGSSVPGTGPHCQSPVLNSTHRGHWDHAFFAQGVCNLPGLTSSAWQRITRSPSTKSCSPIAWEIWKMEWLPSRQLTAGCLLLAGLLRAPPCAGRLRP